MLDLSAGYFISVFWLVAIDYQVLKSVFKKTKPWSSKWECICIRVVWMPDCVWRGESERKRDNLKPIASVQCSRPRVFIKSRSRDMLTTFLKVEFTITFSRSVKCTNKTHTRSRADRYIDERLKPSAGSDRYNQYVCSPHTSIKHTCERIKLP